MIDEKTISGTPLSAIPSSVLREFWLNDSLSSEEYLAETKRRDQAFLTLSRDEVKALLMGAPRESFTAALIRMASWLEGQPVDIERLPYTPTKERP